MAKLDDIFSASMKKPRKLLDLSKVKIFSDADFFKYMDRVPELKLRPEEVDPEDIQIITDFSFTASGASSTPHPVLQRQDTVAAIPSSSISPMVNYSSSSGSNKPHKKYVYEEPLPLCMRSVRLEELWALDIHWKMLTSDRSPLKWEEQLFERLVDLGRFSLAARKQEQATIKAIMSSIIGAPAVTYLVAIGFITTRSRRGTIETRLKYCKHCGQELCTGAYCKLFHYEQFTRMILDKDELENEDREEMAFLKEVSKSGAAGPASSAVASKKKKERDEQGKRLKMQIKKRKRKKKKKTKKVKENVEPVSAPDD